jgi:hypothetical protein
VAVPGIQLPDLTAGAAKQTNSSCRIKRFPPSI